MVSKKAPTLRLGTVCMRMFAGALCVSKAWKQPKCIQQKSGWIFKRVYNKYRAELEPRAATWIHLKKYPRLSEEKVKLWKGVCNLTPSIESFRIWKTR